MKKYILSSLFFISIFATTFAQGKFDINITTPLEANGTKIRFFILDNDKRKVLKKDSAIINNQPVRFSGTISQPSCFVSFTTKINKKFSEKKMVIDTGNNEFVLKELPNKDNFYTLPILAVNSNSNQINSSLDSIAIVFFDRYGKTNKAGFKELDREVTLKANLEQISYLQKHPRNYTSLITLYEISLYHRGSVYTNAILDALKTLHPTLQNSVFGKKFLEEKQEYLRNLTTAKLGGVVPGFTVSDLSGKLFDNSSLRGQDYVIVFSATWCVPCQKSLPEIKELYEKYKSKGLKVVYFNLDDDVIAWRKHVAKNKLTWINVSERGKWGYSKIAKKFNVYSVPSYFVVDKTGTIIHSSVESTSNVDALRKSLEKLYNETK